ncbi:F-box domain-containing protein [Colletotrichum navitas]|uniref:F-box domain-containing protein n=1 Tax=Colletotrichum navitas TaxID=681940 RepID=A0AAD8Q5C1_9PEZI|nr:F-box domain-containing protein [Colletotrichum navitas]KAK1595526.1 F-box domain-containing protein [Colletotrichum navitas]
MKAHPDDVVHFGHDNHASQLVPTAMRLPVEILHHIYDLLDPYDFNVARHTCRPWFCAGLNRTVLVTMLKRGGWWSSINTIIDVEHNKPMLETHDQYPNQEWIMSKWFARECALGPSHRGPEPAFVEVSQTQFIDLRSDASTSGIGDGAKYTASMCGRFLMASYDCTIYVYELNHRCKNIKSPRVLSCAMDTSWGRYSVAAVLDGRNGIVCDITALMPGKEASSQSCICCVRSPSLPPPIETGPRSIYRNICTADNPPRSVAICPQRVCVAFGSSSAVELHWVDSQTNRDLVRRFPLSTRSDFVYFLPPRPAVDSTKKLRLISSAAAVDCCSSSMHLILGALGGSFGGYPPEIPAVISRLETSAAASEADTSSVYTITEQQLSASISPPPFRKTTWRGWERRFPRHRSTAVDNYRAVPLSDGSHILFTDPRTGYLCLGADSPIGSMTRLQRKVQFCPPPTACSNAPTLCAVGANLANGVRIAAVFPIARWVDQLGFQSEKQLLVFYTLPPDMFKDISRLANLADMLDRPMADWIAWWPIPGLRDAAVTHDSGSETPCLQRNRPSYPIDVHGQPVAVCSGLVDLALDTGPDMLVWTFSGDGSARCWALNTGNTKGVRRSTVLRDGSMRAMDGDGDVFMDDAGLNLQSEGISPTATRPLTLDYLPLSYRYCRLTTRGTEDDVVRAGFLENIQGVARLDVDLR